MTLSALALVGGLLAPVSGAQADSAATPDEDPATSATFAASSTTSRPQQPVEVTLITGDRVRYQVGPDGRSQVTVVDAVSTTFDGQETPDGGLYLYPDVAQPYLASGVLDRELFNITYLATNGYDDAQMKQLPLIVDYAGSGRTAAARAAADAEGLAASRAGRVLESIGAAGLSVDKAKAGRFWDSLAPRPAAAAPDVSLAAGKLSDSVDKVWLDRKVRVNLDESVSLIGAPEAWAAGFDGTGVKVAVLDTGVDATHPDLEGQVVASKSFVSDTVKDGHGHGTHVASTVLGSGAASGGRYKGVAPGADLLVGKVLSDAGSGTSAQIIDGMEWAAQEQGADIVSMSLGGGATDGTDPLSVAVNQLTASTGSLFVIAAGNSGPAGMTVGTPGVADAALTVAATDKADKLAWFSSRGPRSDGALKPDIAAPGVHITAARAAGTSLCETGCAQPEDGPVDDHHTSASGTSMATPHIAGAAVILKQQHPDWNAAQLKTVLMSTAHNAGHTIYEQGAGRVDVNRAVSQKLRTDTANISPRILEQEDPAATVPVTYTNESTSDLTVSVAADLRGPDGQPAADGVVSLDHDTVTIPAGGTATVVVTLDPNAGAMGAYRGVITATTSGGDSLRIPVGFTSQPPLNKLTIRLIKPAPVSELPYFFGGFGWWVARVDDRELPWYRGPLGWRDTDDPQVVEAITTVPDGIYSVDGDPNWVRIPGRQMRNTAWVTEPEVTIDGDTVVTIDLRKVVPVTATADKPTEKVWRVYQHSRTTEAGGGMGWWSLNGMPEAYQEWWYPTKPITLGHLQVKQGFILAQPDLQLDLRAGGQRARLQPAYPDHPANIEDRYPKFTEDADTFLATEADVKAGRDVRGALVHYNLPHSGTDPAGFEPCVKDPERSFLCAVTNRAQEAADAGAAGVLLTTPKEGLQYLGFLNDERYVSRMPVPVAWLDATQAERLTKLVRTGDRVDVRLDATVDPAYEYKLMFRETGQVPADLTYEVETRNLKRVDVGYHGPKSSSPELDNAGETLFAFWPGEAAGMSTVRYFDAPTRRAEYYLPQGPDVVHDFGATMYDNVTGDGKLGAHWRTVVGNQAETLDWGTVATPGQVRLDDITRDDVAFAVCVVCRQGDKLSVRHSPTMGAGLQDWTFGYTRSMRLFRADGTEVPADGSGFMLPPEAGRYRLEHVQTDQATDSRYGKQVRTEWNFTATARPTVNEVEFPYGKPRVTDPTPAAWQPVIFVNYDIPLALDNTTPAGRPLTMTVHAAAGKPGSGADVAGLELEASFDDGKTWTKATKLRPLGEGAYQVVLVQPRLDQTTGAVTLRARAWDNAGNEVVQTVDRAYGLR